MSSYLSHEVQQIKKSAHWGLMQITEHAQYRMEQRKMPSDYILKMLQKRDTYIIQHHPVGTYHDNPNELFVCYCKDTCGKDSKPLHIVIAKMDNKYSVVTCYVPNSKIFYAYGRKLR